MFKEEYKDNIYNNPEELWPWGHTEGWSFDGWCLSENVVATEDGGTTCRGGAYQVGDSFSTDERGNYEFVPIFSHIKYTIEYDSNGSQWQYNNGQPQICWEDVSEGKCIVQGDAITRSGYIFKGWCDGTVSDATCNGRTYQKNDIIYAPSGFPASRIIRLTAIWEERNEVITIRTTWTSNTDYDSYMYLSRPNSNGYEYAYWGTDHINVTYHGNTYSLVTGAGDGRGDINNKYYENFVINTLGGKNYYYSLKNFSSSGNFDNSVTVTLSGQYLGTRTFKPGNRTNCTYWNVFAYKDGTIVERNTCSNSIEYGY